MNKRVLAATEIKARLATLRVEIPTLSFKHVPSEKAKVEEIPLCCMLYGVDTISKRSSRTSSPSRSKEGDKRECEIILELIAFQKDGGAYELYKKVREAVLADIYPVKVGGIPDGSTYMLEDRTEGPVGYGLPGVDAMIFVIKVFYNDEF